MQTKRQHPTLAAHAASIGRRRSHARGAGRLATRLCAFALLSLLTTISSLAPFPSQVAHAQDSESQLDEAQGEAEDVPLARLIVITNFESAEVEINNVSYPYEYIYANRQGVLLPANQTLLVRVSVSLQKRRTFRLNLEEGETRVIVVDIENMGEVATAPRTQAPEEEAEEDEEDEDEEDTTGYLGVSSSPRGIVYVDGESTGRRTPARRIELEPGRHRVQVFYESEDEMSETKHVLIRAGTNTNVFFRNR